MNLEPYAPAAALVLLGALLLISFLRARGLLKRFGATARTREPAGPPPRRRPAPAPWWESHLQDYVAEATPAGGSRPLAVRDAVCVDEAPAAGTATGVSAPPEGALTTGRGDVPVQTGLAPCVSQYVMEAPVELWFGETRVGVRAGSDTERRFQRFAEVLFEELAAARSR